MVAIVIPGFPGRGGGGGSGGCPAHGASGGGAGGGSVGIQMIGPPVVTLENRITTLGGGSGGMGGQGGDGGAGGAYAQGTAGHSPGYPVSPWWWDPAGNGERGGWGGRGGPGGGGGGGSGGCSHGQQLLTPVYIWPRGSGDVHDIGPGGPGGQGGPGGLYGEVEAAGEDGLPGPAGDHFGYIIPFPDLDLTLRIPPEAIAERLHEIGGMPDFDINFGVRFPTGDIPMRIIRPGGGIIDRWSPPAPDVEHSMGPGFEFFRVGTPEPGTWTIQLLGTQVPPGGGQASMQLQEIPANLPPTAVPGMSQIIEARGPLGATAVLDGSASLDPNGNLLSFAWDFPFSKKRSGEPWAEVDLPLGTHLLKLTVDDGLGGVDSSEVEVSIVDTTPPVIGLTRTLLVLPTETDSATVDYTGIATATDVVDPAPTIWFDPAEGSRLPQGLFEAVCFADDVFNNVSSDTFQVLVTDAVTSVSGTVLAGDPSAGIEFPAEGALVEARALFGGLVSSCVADSAGSYVLEGLPIDSTYVFSAIGVPGYRVWPADPEMQVSYYPAALGLVMRPDVPPWADITAPPIDLSGAQGPAAWADYDVDGDEDLCVALTAGGARLFRNDGPAGFSLIESEALSSESGVTEGLAWADYDNDGDLDLYLAIDGVDNRLVRNDGGGFFTSVPCGPLQEVGAERGIAWGDYDTDGHVDLFVADYSGDDKLFHNLGDGTFEDATPLVLQDAAPTFAGVWGDYDYDGDPDLYRLSELGNKLFRNDGGSFTDVTTGPLAGNGACRAAAWGDYDSDGDQDLYIGSWQSASLLLRNDEGVFVDATTGAEGAACEIRSVAWIDYDNDGDLDLYRVCADQASVLLANDGYGVFSAVVDGPTLSVARGCAWADFDSDGDQDVYLAGDTPSGILVENVAGGWLNWLQVELRGTGSNAAGIGARVLIDTHGHRQVREIGSHCYGQNSLIASFGVSVETEIDTVRVYWPSGVVQERAMTTANQRMLRIEPGATDTAEPVAHPAALVLHPCRSDLQRGTTTIEYELPAEAVVDLRIYDVSGRLVKDLLRAADQPRGRHSIDWDQRGTGGHPVCSGIYLVHLVAGGQKQSGRLAVLR
ncbi:MAG: VCBS repeat-containing protein [Candidatus Eisenbacteria sp.]|nr:VCBS repeat-containing protein [Candidatus Eisenbacteria bacterium]